MNLVYRLCGSLSFRQPFDFCILRWLAPNSIGSFLHTWVIRPSIRPIWVLRMMWHGCNFAAKLDLVSSWYVIYNIFFTKKQHFVVKRSAVFIYAIRVQKRINMTQVNPITWQGLSSFPHQCLYTAGMPCCLLCDQKGLRQGLGLWLFCKCYR